MDTLIAGAVLLGLMLLMLAGGVWIAMTLAICGWVGQAFFVMSRLEGRVPVADGARRGGVRAWCWT